MSRNLWNPHGSHPTLEGRSGGCQRARRQGTMQLLVNGKTMYECNWRTMEKKKNIFFSSALRNHAGAKWCLGFNSSWLWDIAGGWCQGTIPSTEEQTANEALKDQQQAAAYACFCRGEWAHMSTNYLIWWYLAIRCLNSIRHSLSPQGIHSVVVTADWCCHSTSKQHWNRCLRPAGLVF